jgi:hypothetical protein
VLCCKGYDSSRERDKIPVGKIDVARLNKGKSPEYPSDTPSQSGLLKVGTEACPRLGR